MHVHNILSSSNDLRVDGAIIFTGQGFREDELFAQDHTARIAYHSPSINHYGLLAKASFVTIDASET